MAVVNPPTWLSGNDVNYPPEADRRGLGALVAPRNRDSMQSWSGVKPGTMRPTAPGAGLFVDISAGSCVIRAEGATDGVYVCHNLSPTRAYAPAADGSLPRRDLVVGRVYDEPGRREWTIEVIAGVPSANPATPAAPPLSIPLVWYQLEAGATRISQSMLVDAHFEFVATGGIMPARNRDSFPGAPHEGMTCFSKEDNATYQWTGVNWRQIPYVPARSVDLQQTDFYRLGSTSDLRAPRRDQLHATRTFRNPQFNSRMHLDGGVTVTAVDGSAQAMFQVYVDGFLAGTSRFFSERAAESFVGLHARAPILGVGDHSVYVMVETQAGRVRLSFLHWDIYLEPVAA